MPDRYVIGIDLSLTATGLADLNIDRGVFTGVDTFGTKGKRGDKWSHRGGRLTHMAEHIIHWATAGPTDPALVVVEGPSYGSVNGSQHDRSGLWWLVVSGFQGRGIPVLVVSPKTRAKYATGNGNSGKDVVVAHVAHRYDAALEGCRISNDNEADAVALAAMGARYLDEPMEEELPADNLAAMEGIEAM